MSSVSVLPGRSLNRLAFAASRAPETRLADACPLVQRSLRYGGGGGRSTTYD